MGASGNRRSRPGGRLRTRGSAPQGDHSWAAFSGEVRLASIITVEPAWKAASSAAKGSAATTRPKYVRSLIRRPAAVSGIRRTLLAIGSNDGARLLASPAGLSRKEKNLRRT